MRLYPGLAASPPAVGILKVGREVLLGLSSLPRRDSSRDFTPPQVLLEQRVQRGQRHGALLQGAIVKFRQVEGPALLRLIYIADPQPSAPAQKVHRQLARRELGALQFAGRLFLLLEGL